MVPFFVFADVAQRLKRKKNSHFWEVRSPLLTCWHLTRAILMHSPLVEAPEDVRSTKKQLCPFIRRPSPWRGALFCENSISLFMRATLSNVPGLISSLKASPRNTVPVRFKFPPHAFGELANRQMGWNQCSKTHLWLLKEVFRGINSNSNQWLPKCLDYENPDRKNIPCVMPVTFYICGQT